MSSILCFPPLHFGTLVRERCSVISLLGHGYFSYSFVCGCQHQCPDTGDLQPPMPHGTLEAGQGRDATPQAIPAVMVQGPDLKTWSSWSHL